MPQRPLLIERWLPIAALGAECLRERGASSALPPLYYLHVWWARRPLTVSRAAVLASLLPAYPTATDEVPPWPRKLRRRFPTFESYQDWFLRLLGIAGDPVAGWRRVQRANAKGIKLREHPYGYARAFTVNPSSEQLAVLGDLLQWTWGTRDVTVCDPMAGGGSIPFEALRFGLAVTANELNPVAGVLLKATLDYPARFGAELVEQVRHYGAVWAKMVRARLAEFYPQQEPGENIFAYLWARTIPCPVTNRPVPLSPNWWLRKGARPLALRLIADPSADRCRFEVVEGADFVRHDPDQGTVKRGIGVNPWRNNEPIAGDYIKAQAQAGAMGQQLIAIGIKQARKCTFRPPTADDERAFDAAAREVKARLAEWDAAELLPTEPRRAGRADWACTIYGMTRWADTYHPRQLLAMITMTECLHHVGRQVEADLGRERAEAVRVYLALAVDKAADYNSRQARWDTTRSKIANSFARHDLSMRWSHAEFDAARNLAPWVCEQVCDAADSLGRLLAPARVEKLWLTTGDAQKLTGIASGSIRCITVDPPYYGNVHYAECSNYFYIWLKRTLGEQFPDLFRSELTNANDEAVMNRARFRGAGRGARQLAATHYEDKMRECFREMARVLTDDGVLTVMFTHRQIEAWDILGRALLQVGFRIDASWPVRTENDRSLHLAKKNAAGSTVLLVCRKRACTRPPVAWDDLKDRIRQTIRRKAAEFERAGISGVDLELSTFGPVLAVISEHWPVLTAERDAAGQPLPLRLGEALELARQELLPATGRGVVRQRPRS